MIRRVGMIKLSVIVPVYNTATGGKLQFCLDSLLNQKLDYEYEIIAVNDASTDNSLDILRTYEKQNSTVKVITYEKNRHQGGARNEGIKAARGEWIGFIDSDDWVARDYFAKLIKRAEETGADVVGCTYNLVSEQTFNVGKVCVTNNINQSGILDTQKRKLFLKNQGSAVTKIYRSNLIRDNNLFFPENIFL